MTNALLIIGAYMALASLSPELNAKFDASQWNSFKQEHGKAYENSNIEAMRRIIFAHNYENIRQFNEQQSEALGFEVDVNQFADLSVHEFKNYKGFKLPKSGASKPLLSKNYNKLSGQRFLAGVLADNSIEVPDALDWRTVPGRVSRVKNQGSCGSCWAFASTGALEGQEMKRLNLSSSGGGVGGGNLIELSEQNLIDCVKKDYGCNGGIMADAFEFIRDEQGIDDELSYPYEGRTKKCRFQRNKVAMSDSGSVILPQGDEQKLKEVVAKFGPVAVAIDASSIWFQFYKHGVYYDKHCRNKPDELDHAVLVVGYGTDPKKGDYWLVKNSWGPKYGEKGYIRMSRNRGNNCGIASMATIPTF